MRNRQFRWFKQRNEAFRIDTNLIFAGGWSAGGYTLSGLAWMNDESEKPFQANALNDTLVNNMIYNRPDLGSVQGIFKSEWVFNNCERNFLFLFIIHISESFRC